MSSLNRKTEMASAKGQSYWRSLDEYSQTAEFQEFMHREFSDGASELLGEDRRSFIKLMGASLALAGLTMTGCRRWPDEKIAPYAHRPAGRDPGTPVHYATTMELGGVGYGLLVKSYDGRPIKIEGNDRHPINGTPGVPHREARGTTDAIMQATILDLYDPDRSRTVMKGGQASSWSAFESFVKDHFGGLKGKGGAIRVLSEATTSPTMAGLKSAFAKAYPGSKWYEYEALSNDNQIDGLKAAFGEAKRPHYSLDKAKVIVSLDSDFLLTHPASLKLARDFAAMRRPSDAKGSFSRLYVLESTLSMTGICADQRVAMRSSDVPAAAAWIASKLGGSSPVTAAASGLLEGEAGKAVEANAAVLEKLVEDLKAAQGAAVVIAGPRMPSAVHALAAAINEQIGAVGTTVSYSTEPAANSGEALKALCGEMSGVDTLVVIGCNPVYTAAADLDFGGLLKKVQTSIHLGTHLDETGRVCTWHVPCTHYLESWGDARAYDGTIGITQPLIAPMIEEAQRGVSAIELVSMLTSGEVKPGMELVKGTYATMTGGEGADLEMRWRRVLDDGVFAGTAWEKSKPSVNAAGASGLMAGLKESMASAKAGAIELVLLQDGKVHDGRFANNGWLQELPDQVTKLVWDNALLMSPAMAKQLGVDRGDVVDIKVGGRSLNGVAAYPLPGHADRSVSLALGYGRGAAAGVIGEGAGFNGYSLRTSGSGGVLSDVTVTKAAGSYVLASTQDHGAVSPLSDIPKQGIQQRLPTLVREGTIDEYREHPQFAKHPAGHHVAHRLSLWEENLPFHEGAREGAPDRHAWAMTIDLSTCTGCSACVTACQAENNIPVVGKDQVNRGREMHWIRIDRYFAFKAAKHDHDGVPTEYDLSTLEKVAVQPVTCQHCENAPCEQVCPVAATTHDSEGLNVMVYNRCIGTRYCSNNCPYKVRRFNYFDFNRRDPVRENPGLMHVKPEYYLKDGAPPLRAMQFNPEVTVRSRGVMEKCTFCVQRINEVKIAAKNEWARSRSNGTAMSESYRIDDGLVTPACAQACPTQAIVFGDLSDPKSRVSQLTKHERAYQLLEELNTKPRLKYLARLRNPAIASAAPHQHGGGGSHDTHSDHEKEAHG